MAERKGKKVRFKPIPLPEPPRGYKWVAGKLERIIRKPREWRAYFQHGVKPLKVARKRKRPFKKSEIDGY